jgi:hypothetical protein
VFDIDLPEQDLDILIYTKKKDFFFVYYMTEQVYSFLLDSRDKISGDNNTATFNIMFSILPREYKYYKVAFSFYTQPSYFIDVINTVDANIIDSFTGMGRILTNLLLQNSMRSDNSPSNQLGFITRSTSTQNTTATNHICYIQAQKGTNQEIVVLRPDVDQISLKILNGISNTAPYVSTTSTGSSDTDLPDYILQLQFTPVREFHTTS